MLLYWFICGEIRFFADIPKYYLPENGIVLWNSKFHGLNNSYYRWRKMTRCQRWYAWIASISSLWPPSSNSNVFHPTKPSRNASKSSRRPLLLYLHLLPEMVCTHWFTLHQTLHPCWYVSQLLCQFFKASRMFPTWLNDWFFKDKPKSTSMHLVKNATHVTHEVSVSFAYNMP